MLLLHGVVLGSHLELEEAEAWEHREEHGDREHTEDNGDIRRDPLGVLFDMRGCTSRATITDMSFRGQVLVLLAALTLALMAILLY